MLVLSRRVGESIVIGNQVTVTVLEVRGDQIRVGIDAPRDVQVNREEVHRSLQEENRGAADSAERARRLVARMPSAARRPDGGPGSPGSGRSGPGAHPGRPGAPPGSPGAPPGKPGAPPGKPGPGTP